MGLIELLIALTIMNIGLFAIVAAFSSGTVATTHAGRIATGTTIADAQMEIYRALTYNWIGLDTTATTDATYRGDAACYGGGTCQNFAPTNGASCAAGGSVKTSFPNACSPSRTLTGPDGHTYRLDTYIRQVPAVTTPLPQRPYKQITVVVRDPTAGLVLAREQSAFDCATAATGSTCPA